MDRDEEQNKRQRGDESSKSAGRPRDPVHQYFFTRSDDDALQCLFCKHKMSSARVSRTLIPHLLQCKAARGKVDLQHLRMSADHNCLQDNLQDGKVDEQEKALLISSCMIVNRAVAVALVEDKYFGMLWSYLKNKDRVADVRPPSREQVSGLGLQRLVYLYGKHMSESLKREPLTIAFDGWKTRSGRSVYAFVAVTGRGHAFLLHAADMSGRKADALTLLLEIRHAVNNFPDDKVHCIVSDGARNCLSARTSFVAEHPHVQSFSCITHVINLIFKNAYKLDGLSRMAAMVQSVLYAFKRSSKYEASLESVYRDLDIKVPGKLVQVCDTRFATIYTSSKSFLDNKRGLQHLAASGSFKSNNTIETTLTDPTFWRDLESSILLLKPLYDLLQKSESTCYSPGQAFRDCIDMLYLLVEAIRADQSLPKDCFTGLLQILQKRLYPLQDKPLFAFAACLLPDQSNLPWKVQEFETLADYYSSYLSAMGITGDENLQAGRQVFLTYIKAHQGKSLLNMAKAHLYLQRCEGGAPNTLDPDCLAPCADDKPPKDDDSAADDSSMAEDDQLFDEDSDDERPDTETGPGHASSVDLWSFANICFLFPNLCRYLEVSSPSLVEHLQTRAPDDFPSSSQTEYGMFESYF